MDDRLRKLEREALLGDSASRRRLDEATLRIGGTPSWDYLLEEQERVNQLFKEHLRQAIEMDLQRVFEKHGEVVQAVFWDSSYVLGIDQWCRGLEIHVPDRYYLQKIYFRDDIDSPVNDAGKIHQHLTTSKCDCKSFCYIRINLGSGDRYALANLLTDLSQIYLKLDKSPRWFGDPGKKYRYDLEDGLVWSK
jgi:hypothetical protein